MQVRAAAPAAQQRACLCDALMSATGHVHASLHRRIDSACMPQTCMMVREAHSRLLPADPVRSVGTWACMFASLHQCSNCRFTLQTCMACFEADVRLLPAGPVRSTATNTATTTARTCWTSSATRPSTAWTPPTLRAPRTTRPCPRRAPMASRASGCWRCTCCRTPPSAGARAAQPDRSHGPAVRVLCYLARYTPHVLGHLLHDRAQGPASSSSLQHVPRPCGYSMHFGFVSVLACVAAGKAGCQICPAGCKEGFARCDRLTGCVLTPAATCAGMQGSMRTC